MLVSSLPIQNNTHFAADSYQLYGSLTPGAVLARIPSLAVTDRGKYRVGDRPVTGHESHYPYRLSSPQRVLPVVFKLLFVACLLTQGLGAVLVRLETAESYKMFLIQLYKGYYFVFSTVL